LLSAPSSIFPAIEAIIDTSSNSAGESGGKIVGSRAASIDFPAPGGPIMSMLCRQCQKGSACSQGGSCPGTNPELI
jgi:hypothetical protein